MQGHGGANKVDDIRRIRVDCGAGYVSIPKTIRRKRNEAVQASSGPEAHSAASTALRKRCPGPRQSNNRSYRQDAGNLSHAPPWLRDRRTAVTRLERFLPALQGSMLFPQ